MVDYSEPAKERKKSEEEEKQIIIIFFSAGSTRAHTLKLNGEQVQNENPHRYRVSATKYSKLTMRTQNGKADPDFLRKFGIIVLAAAVWDNRQNEYRDREKEHSLY